MAYEPVGDVFTLKPYAKLLEKSIPMTKRGVSSIIPSIYDCSGHIAPNILKGKSILSRIWAYEKAFSLYLEKVTSHDKAEILLAQFKESEWSPDPQENSGSENGKYIGLPKFFSCPSPNVQTPWNSILSKPSMDNMQNSSSIAKDTGKDPGDGSGGASDGGEVDDSNDNSVHYQYKGAGEKPSDPGKSSHLKRDDPSTGNGFERPSDPVKHAQMNQSNELDVNPRSPDPNMKSDDKVQYQYEATEDIKPADPGKHIVGHRNDQIVLQAWTNCQKMLQNCRILVG